MEVLDLMKNLNINQLDSAQQLFKSVAADIDDVHTEIVFSDFTDKTLLIISQYDKIGSMLTVQKAQICTSQGSDTVYTTKVLFGATGEKQEVAARYFAEALKITKPLSIFINLKSYDIKTVKACRDIILDIKTQAENN